MKSQTHSKHQQQENEPHLKKLALGDNFSHRTAFANLTNMHNNVPSNAVMGTKKGTAATTAFQFQAPPQFKQASASGPSLAASSLSNVRPTSSSDLMEIEDSKVHSTITLEEVEEVSLSDNNKSLDMSHEDNNNNNHPAHLAQDELDNLYDIDSADEEDPQFVCEYVLEVFRYLKNRESVERDRPNPNYLATQPEIKERHRSTLADWLVDVALKFDLTSDTLLLAINFMDRFLSKKPVKKDQVQLVGIASLMIAAKYEEIYCPEVSDYIWIAARAYTKEELLTMERDILCELNFELVVPTSLQFLRRFSKAAESDPRAHTLSKYLCELAILDSFFLKYKPSEIAASAVFLSRAILEDDIDTIWTPTVQHHTGYTVDHLTPLIKHLNDLHASMSTSCPYQAVFKKYSSHKFMGVALSLPLSFL